MSCLTFDLRLIKLASRFDLVWSGLVWISQLEQETDSTGSTGSGGQGAGVFRVGVPRQAWFK